ncbi:MAG: FtsX-like permease family protein [Oscillospiraceae bacterium]|nr:FtsX-like permease family protein [Oscillospiraceae bacterium]
MIRKTIFREIKGSLGRFIAIFAIIALGTGFFAGLRTCKPAMQNAGDKYLAEQNFFDYRLVSTVGYADEDVAAVGAVQGVKKAVGAISMDVMVYSDYLAEATGDSSSVVMMAEMITPGVNDPKLTAGRMPQAADECLGDAFHFTEDAIGSTITLTSDNDDDRLDTFACNEYTVVGLATSPLYMNFERGSTSLGSGVISSFFYLTEDSFDADYYTQIYLTLTDAQGLYIYSDEYKAVSESYEDILTAVAEDAAARRYEEIRRDAMTELSDGEKEYADGMQEYLDGKAEAEQELADAWQELSDAKADIEDAEIEIADAWVEFRTEMTDAKQELSDAERDLADAFAELTDAETEYAEGLAEYEKAMSDFESGKAEFTDGFKKYYDGLSEYNKGFDEWSKYKEELDRADIAMANGAAQLSQYKAQYQQMQALYNGVSAAASAQGTDAATFIAGLKMLIIAADGGDAMAAAQLAALDSMVQSMGVADTRALVASWDAAEAAIISQGYGTALDENALNVMGTALTDAENQLTWGAIELQKARTQLSEAKKELDEAKAELDDAWSEIHDGNMTIYDGENELADAAAELGVARTDIDNGWAEYYGGLQDVSDGWNELYSEEARITAELHDAEQELADGKLEYSDGVQEYLEGKSEAHRELLDAEAELADARAELDDGWQQYRDLKSPSVYCLNRDTNLGFSCFKNDSEIVQGLSTVFPVFFYIVAALICITTMTRMVDEQRTQIGVMKALGYGSGAIISKYIVYSASASLLGCISGYFLGTVFLPKIIWAAYKIMYNFGDIEYTFLPALAAGCVFAYLAGVILVTWLCCRSTLRLVAADLMRPKAPKSGKRVIFERIPFLWNRMSFLGKVSVRNILRYKQRLIMMIIGICGCSALVLTGFGVRDSISNVVYFQYDEITTYDCLVSTGDEHDEKWVDELVEYMDGDVAEAMLVSEVSVDVTIDGLTKTLMMIVPKDDISPYIDLHYKGEQIPYPGPGETVVCTSVADHFDLEVGDTFTARDPDLNQVELTVSGICENYVYNYIYVSLDTCRDTMGLGDDMSGLLINFSEGTDHSGAAAKLLNYDDVTSAVVSEEFKERITSMMDSMDFIVLLVIVFAAGLAVIVLYNLTNISLTERVREIATIKVLGFYPMQTATYVFRENLVLTVIGSLLGLLVGVWLHGFAISKIRLDMIFFQPRIIPVSYVLSVVLTVVFALIVDALMYKKVKKINMAEALKSIE